VPRGLTVAGPPPPPLDFSTPPPPPGVLQPYPPGAVLFTYDQQMQPCDLPPEAQAIVDSYSAG